MANLARIALLTAMAASQLAPLGAPASAQTLVLPDGAALARELCADCHPAASGSKGKATGPSFEDIARMPSMTELAVKVFLQSSHRNMPNLKLTADEIDALAAYIVRLRP